MWGLYSICVGELYSISVCMGYIASVWGNYSICICGEQYIASVCGGSI